jgi:FkbM family methyltransferase
MSHYLTISTPTLREKLISRATRLYPFMSGCNRIANSKALDWVAGRRLASVWCKTEGGDILVPVNEFVGRSIFYMGDLDRKVSWVVDKFVHPGDTVLDIGANLGLVSLRMAKRVGQAGRVVAFEPNPVVLEYLCKTVERNGSRIEVHPLALGCREETLALEVPMINFGQGSFRSTYRGEQQSYQVPVRTLSSYAAEIGLSRADFIKVDVEGFEADVFSGGMDFLEAYRPKVILFEEGGACNGKSPPESMKILKRLGYELFGLPSVLFHPKLVRLEDIQGRRSHDFIAMSPEALS